MDDVVSIAELIEGLAGPWQPVDVVVANNAVVRLARFEGAFPWHHHDEDELFLCWDGSFRSRWRSRARHAGRRRSVRGATRGRAPAGGGGTRARADAGTTADEAVRQRLGSGYARAADHRRPRAVR